MMNQKALQKKLQELGIPTNGRKELLIRRHTEWMHLWNANCDALDNRKPKGQLLKELDVWERTQGGNASTTEPKVMRKDYDGQAHATAHKTQFDDLIASAKRKREAAKQEKEAGKNGEKNGEDVRTDETAPQSTVPQSERQPVDASHAYDGNETALASIREKVEQANQVNTQLEPAPAPTTFSSERQTRPASQECQGMPNPFGAPSRKMPMFALPEDPIVDIEQSTIGQ
jgi:E3 ubiquitin-protein ligase RAD18